MRPSAQQARARWTAAAVAALGASFALGCSSSSGTGPPTMTPTGDMPGASTGDMPDASTGAPVTTTGNVNPDGVPYPTPAGGYGHAARKGKTPGSIIQDFKFLGYPDASVSTSLKTIALGDYYDPCNKRLKLLHISVAAVWCTPCNEETQALVAAKSELDAEGVVLVQALSDGPTMNVGATQSDLNYWINENHADFTEMLDPGLTNLGTFFNAAAVPWNADIDPRTMEIIDEGTGWAQTVDKELAPGLAAVADAPDYDLAVACP